jgi:hypothetical protein
VASAGNKIGDQEAQALARAFDKHLTADVEALQCVLREERGGHLRGA